MASIGDPEPTQDLSEGVELTREARSQLEAFRSAHETQVLTILLSDLVSSTQQQSDLGNVRAAELVQDHRTVFRKVLEGFDGQEVETAGDSFLTIFAAPSEGVGFALHMQAAMRQARETVPELPPVRVGLHQGQVVVQRDEADALVDDIYGVQVSTTARIMDLADGGQVLCSRAIFDDARAILRGNEVEGLAPLVWCNHGPYKFKGVMDAYDVCEVGEEGLAPLTAPPASDKSWPADQDEVPGWRPAVGVVVPESNWALQERLGKEGPTTEGPPQYRGAFGEVWQARNLSDKSQQVFKFCFRREHVPALKREARLLKSLQKHRHPNLVDVYDVTVGHRPPYYLQMEYVDGPSLDEWILTDPPLAERLEIVAQIADALDTVHAAGIFHRDIKPSNILLTHRADGTLQAKLADFGLGAADDPELLQSIYVSRVSGVAGTWDYMAPELRDGHKAGPQSDLYSLGMTLYQLVIGNLRHPLTADWQAQIDSEVLREDIGRCIAEAPDRRWPSAADLAQALRSHDQRLRERRLEREREQQRRRNKRLRTVTGLVAAFAVVMVGFGLWAFHERQQKEAQRADAEQAKAAAIESRERAVRNEAIAVRTAHTLAISRGWWLLEDGDPAKALFWQVEALRLLQSLREEGKDDPAIDTAEINQRIRIQQVLNSAPVPQAMFFHDAPVFCLAFSPDGTRMVTGGDGNAAQVWDTATGELVTPPMQTPGKLSCVTFSPDGTRLATADFDSTARIWDAVTGEPVTPPMEHEKGVGWVAFSSDGARVVTASYDDTARVWDAATGEPVTPPLAHEGWVSCAAFSPDGTRVVTTSYDNTAMIWNAATGEPAAPPLTHQGQARWVAVSPDGAWIVTASNDGAARIWDAATGVLRTPPLGHDGEVRWVAISPDGTRIATASYDNTARVWDAATGEPVTPPLPHNGAVRSVAFSPEGTRVVSVCYDHTARVWNALTGEPITPRLEHSSLIYQAAFRPDGTQVVTTSQDHTARFWNAAAGDPAMAPLKHDGSVWQARFSTDGTRVITASADGTARIWNTVTGEPVTAPLEHEEEVTCVAFSPDGGRVATASNDDTVQIWNAVTGEPTGPLLEHDDPVGSVAFSPDGARIVTADYEGVTRVWDAETGEPVTPPMTHEEPVVWVAFSPDGTRVVTASYDDTAQIWDAATGEPAAPPLEHDEDVDWAVFSPDGTRVVTTSDDHTARIWNAATGEMVTPPLAHNGWVWQAVFSPDGTRVVTASLDNTGRVWDAATGEPVTPPLEHHDHVNSVAFSPDGRRVVTASDDHTARIWDAVTGDAVTPPLAHDDDVEWAAFSPDGVHVVTASDDHTARIWKVTGTELSLAQLKLLAQLLSGYKMLDETGTPLLMTPEEFQDAWRQWHAK